MGNLILNATPLLQGCAIAMCAAVITVRTTMRKKHAKASLEASQAAARRRFEVFRY